MATNLRLPAIAVMTFALTLPAMASAAPTLTNSKGGVLPTSTLITATAEDITIVDSVTSFITCGVLTFSGAVPTNDDTNGWTATSFNQFSTENCINKNGAVTFTSMEVADLKAVVSGHVSFNFKAVIDLGAKISCTFTGTNVEGTYTPGSDTITFSQAGGVAGGACGTAVLTGEATVETESSPVHSS